MKLKHHLINCQQWSSVALRETQGNANFSQNSLDIIWKSFPFAGIFMFCFQNVQLTQTRKRGGGVGVGREREHSTFGGQLRTGVNFGFELHVKKQSWLRWAQNRKGERRARRVSRSNLGWLTKSVAELGLKLEGCTFIFYIWPELIVEPACSVFKSSEDWLCSLLLMLVSTISTKLKFSPVQSSDFLFILISLRLLEVLSFSGTPLEFQRCSQERHQACPLKQQRRFCIFQEMLLIAGIGIGEKTGDQAAFPVTGTCLLWSWWSLGLFKGLNRLDDVILIFLLNQPLATSIHFWYLCRVMYLHDNSSVRRLPLALILFWRYLPAAFASSLFAGYQCHLQMLLMNFTSNGKVLSCAACISTNTFLGPFISKFHF